jgi:hypothetical protein
MCVLIEIRLFTQKLKLLHMIVALLNKSLQCPRLSNLAFSHKALENQSIYRGITPLPND